MILATIILLIQKSRIYDRKELLLFALLTMAKNICGISAGIVIYFLSQSADRELPRGTLVKAVCWEGEADE